MIAVYILMQAKLGKASVAGSCDVIAQAQARDTGKLAASRVQVLAGVTRTMSCPVVHL